MEGNGNNVEEPEGAKGDDDAAENNNPEILNILKRKTPEPSPIWTNKCGTSSEEGAKCAFCKKFYKSSTSSTTNLANHLKNITRTNPRCSSS